VSEQETPARLPEFADFFGPAAEAWALDMDARIKAKRAQAATTETRHHTATD